MTSPINNNNDELRILLKKLRPFQRDGFDFAMKCSDENKNDGGRILLADEMVSNMEF